MDPDQIPPGIEVETSGDGYQAPPLEQVGTMQVRYVYTGEIKPLGVIPPFDYEMPIQLPQH